MSVTRNPQALHGAEDEQYFADEIHDHFDIIDARHEDDAARNEAKNYEPVKVKLPAAADATYRTFVLDPVNNPFRRILPRDECRKRATIIAVDNDIVIAENREMASDAANQATNVPSPDGFYLPKGIPGVVLENESEVWAALTVTTGNTRVSVCIERG